MRGASLGAWGGIVNLANAAFSGCDGNHVCEVFMRGAGTGVLIFWIIVAGSLIAGMYREKS